MITVDSIVTPGEIARHLRQPIHRVRHVLDTRDEIKPLRRIGIVRAYSADTIERVREELAAIDSRRTAGSR